MICPSCKADLYLNKDGINRSRISCTGSTVFCSFYNCCFKNDKLQEFYFKDNKSYDVGSRILLRLVDGEISLCIKEKFFSNVNIDLDKYNQSEESIYELYNDCIAIINKFRKNLLLM